jgi:hypothetical protein
MGIYKDAQNFVPYDFNSAVLTLDGEIVVDGLDSFSAERDADRVTSMTVADGLGMLVLDPSKVVTFTFSVLEASASTDSLYTLLETDTPFKLSFIDSNAENFNCSGTYCMFTKHPTAKREKEVPLVEWTITTIYGSMRGGSFTLQT